MTEFEIVWDGNIQAPHRGLLCTPEALHETRSGRDLPPPSVVHLPRPCPATERLRMLLAIRPRTCAEIRLELGMGYNGAQSAIGRLREAGELVIEPTPLTGQMGRRRVRYRLVEGA